MTVDVKVPLAGNIEVHEPVKRQLIQHMIKKTDSGIGFTCSFTIKVQFDIYQGSRVLRSILAVLDLGIFQKE